VLWNHVFGGVQEHLGDVALDVLDLQTEHHDAQALEYDEG